MSSKNSRPPDLRAVPVSAHDDFAAIMGAEETLALIAAFDDRQRTGRPGYPRRALVGIAILRTMFALPSWERACALVRDGPEIQEILDLASADDIPSVPSMYRFGRYWRQWLLRTGAIDPMPRCPGGHAYTKANTYVGKKGRQCRACRREYWQARFGSGCRSAPPTLTRLIDEQRHEDGYGERDVRGRSGLSVSKRMERSIEAFQEMGAMKALARIGIDASNDHGRGRQ